MQTPRAVVLAVALTAGVAAGSSSRVMAQRAAAPPAANTGETAVQPLSPLPAAAADQAQSAEILRAQLEAAQRDDQRMETIVLWALALVVFVTVVLIAGSWITSRALAARNRSDLRMFFDAELRDRLADFDRQQDAAIDQRAARIEAAAERAQRETTESLRAELRELRSRVAAADYVIRREKVHLALRSTDPEDRASIPANLAAALTSCRDMEEGEHLLEFVLDDVRKLLQLQPPPAVDDEELDRLRAGLLDVKGPNAGAAHGLIDALHARFARV